MKHVYDFQDGDKGTCSVCKNEFELGEMYEYRGMIACEKCFNKACEQRDAERADIIAENKARTNKFAGLDMSDSSIGKANREILKADIEIAKKENGRLKNYEGRI